MINLLEKINLTDLCVVLFCGVGLILGILSKQLEIATALGGGLLGYVGGKGASK